MKIQYEHSLQEVADELGCSRETVRKIELSALEKAKAHFLAIGLGPTALDDDWSPGAVVMYDVNSRLPVLFYK